VGFLSISEDELALMRFTCDLFFVEESPLFHIDAEQKEPSDYEAAYRSLLKKKAIDPRGFRITDEVLNRLAPVTECNSRVVHLNQDENSNLHQNDFYLLDDIAVQYLSGDQGHAFGVDMDQAELVEYFGRRMIPRRSAGDVINLSLSPIEYLVFALLVRPAQMRSPSDIPLAELRTLLGRSPTRELLTRDLIGSAGGNLLSVMQMRAPRSQPNYTDKTIERFIGDPLWDEAIDGLFKKHVLTKTNNGIFLRPVLLEIVEHMTQRQRHTFVRYDFGHDEWLMRENTFLPVDGSLFFLGMESDGFMQIKELTADSFRETLEGAIGPLPMNVELKGQSDFRQKFLQADGDTLVSAATPMRTHRAT
jgi:hypothetical protein